MAPSQYTKEHQGRRQRGRSFEWSQAATDLLIKLRRQGFSASECAYGLARAGAGTFSRSAVMGRIKRLERKGQLSPVTTTTAIYTLSSLSTGDVLGTFLRDVCEVAVW